MWRGRARLRARRKAGGWIVWKRGMSLPITCEFTGQKEVEGGGGKLGM